MIYFLTGPGESQSLCLHPARAKLMNPRSTSSPIRSTRTRPPTSRPSNPRITFPSTGGWNRLQEIGDGFKFRNKNVNPTLIWLMGAPHSSPVRTRHLLQHPYHIDFAGSSSNADFVQSSARDAKLDLLLPDVYNLQRDWSSWQGHLTPLQAGIVIFLARPVILLNIYQGVSV